MLLIALLFSCGGGDGSLRVEFRLLSPAGAPYYTKVSVRVSGFEFEPIEKSKDGRFYPGDRVSFELDLPEGKERHIEAVIFDHEGKPAYYGRKTLDLKRNQTVVMEMLPTSTSYGVREQFLDAQMPLPSLELYLISEDLYSLNSNYDLKGPHLWLGSYLAFKDQRGLILHYLEGPMERVFGGIFPKNIELTLPPGEKGLYLYGSFEGWVDEGVKVLSLASNLTLSDGRALLAGYGDRLYYSLSSVRTDFRPACELFRCGVLKLEAQGPGIRDTLLFLEYLGLRVPAQEGERFPLVDGGSYLLRLRGGMKEPCIMDYTLFVPLGARFSGEGKLSLDVRKVRVEGIKPQAHIRVYSDNLSMEGQCESSAKEELYIPFYEREDLWVEANYPKGLSVGRKIGKGAESLSMPNISLELRDYNLREGTLSFRFERVGFNGWCSLRLKWENDEVYVDRMPPWRSYIRLRNISEDRLPDYTLTCFTEDGESYVKLSSIKPLEYLPLSN